ncbi:hypothetical protein B0H14DRAFT_2628007 [Mycena olivaceomarginata]|nr:hypothetical protein B0H14DRAFT_2628007 [Mycena olivaceomarginata]
MRVRVACAEEQRGPGDEGIDSVEEAARRERLTSHGAGGEMATKHFILVLPSMSRAFAGVVGTLVIVSAVMFEFELCMRLRTGMTLHRQTFGTPQTMWNLRLFAS